MMRDLKEEIDRTDRVPGSLGMDFDEREWRNLYEFMLERETHASNDGA